MNGRSGFRGVGYGFVNVGKPDPGPSVRRVFREAVDDKPLGPRFEKLIKKYAHDILRDLEGAPVHGTHDDDLERRLRMFAREMEMAEGEGTEEIEQ